MFGVKYNINSGYSVTIFGDSICPEDGALYSCYGATYKVSEQVDCDFTYDLVDAIKMADTFMATYKSHLQQVSEFDDYLILGFFPKRVHIKDQNGSLVIAGIISNDILKWVTPIYDEKSILEIKNRQRELNDRSFLEGGWDNHETARMLSAQSSDLGLCLADPLYQRIVNELTASNIVELHAL